MKAEVLSQFNHIWLPSSVLILFVIVFMGMLMIIFRRNSTELYKQVANLPLEDEGGNIL